MRIGKNNYFYTITITCIASSLFTCNAKSSSSTTTLTTSTSTATSTATSLQKHNHLLSLSKIAPLLGESAIVDKESGRVYWQGGKQSLFHSTVGHTYLSNKNGIARHVRSTLYSCILWMTLIQFLAQKILLLGNIYFYDHINITPRVRVIRAIFLYMAKIIRIVILCVAYLPRLSNKFITFIAVCYIVEAYTCSTRKFLNHKLTSPEAAESCLEMMKDQKPSIKWNIRCYHYEKRKLLCALLMIDLWQYLHKLILCKKKYEDKDDDEEGQQTIQTELRPSMLTKKVVTHESSMFYKFDSWEDETIGAIWKLGSFVTTSNISAFTKISMHKLILFADSKTRSNFFAQQSKFIISEGQKDMFAEISTKVDVEGYKPKLLVVKQTQGILPKIFSIQFYWIFTLLLLTVPFRIKFARHCDELHITLAKETSMDDPKKAESTSLVTKSWFSPFKFSETD